jgi:hypothetical protein
MKPALSILALLVVLGLGAYPVEAQVYSPYYAPYPYYAPSQDVIPYPAPAQEAYPYYQLEALHYQVYVPYLYAGYPFYQPCCIGTIIVPPAAVIAPRPPVVIAPRVMRRR